MPSVKGSAENARTLESAFRGFHGVRQVNANPLTGSLLIHYDPEATSLDWLAAMVPSAKTPAAAHTLAGAVTSFVVQNAIEKAVVALIAAVL